MSDKYFIFSGDEKKKINKIMVNKSEEEICNYLKSLNDWIKKESHLPQNEDERILRKMLIINKFSIEKTKGKLDTMYTGKSLMPEFFENFFPKHNSIQKIMKQCIYVLFPNLTPSFERVGLLKVSCKNIQDFEAVDLIRLIFLATEIRLLTDLSVGDIVIVDLADCSLPIVTKFSPRLLQNTFNYLNGAFTDRIKGIHFINVPSYAYNLITFLKSVLKNKLAERVHVHKYIDTLYIEVSRQVLPKDLGGSQKSIHEIYSDWRKFLENHNAWFIERSQMKSNEKLRTGAPLNSEFVGVQGSFQKLVID